MTHWARPLAAALLLLPVVALAAQRGVPWRAGDEMAAYRLCGHLLVEGDDAGAVQAFAGATSARDPETRRRAWHNLAVAHLRLATEASGEARATQARDAAAAAMEALRLGPWNEGARRNLALALTMLGGEVPVTTAAGGPGARGPEAGEDDVRPTPQGATHGDPSLTPEEAGRILDALRSGEGGRAVAGIMSGAGGPARDDTRRRGPPW
jgi:hypothetical protein